MGKIQSKLSERNTLRMYDPLSDEFDDINVLISLRAGEMFVYVHTQEESYMEAGQCITLTQYVELVREFVARKRNSQEN